MSMCKHPLVRNSNGVTHIGRLSQDERLAATPLPCGRCLPCRQNAARLKKLRILLENSTHKESLWTTLTVADSYILSAKSDYNLHPKMMKNFHQRLRRRLDGKNYRYYLVGEYGRTSTRRPHYHLCLFGLGQTDIPAIDDAWTKKGQAIGNTDHGEVNPSSAGYIADYAARKLTKKGDPRLQGRTPEFNRMSTRGGGLGSQAIINFGQYLAQQPYFKPRVINEITINGKGYPLGRYLTRLLGKQLGLTESDYEEHFHRYSDEVIQKHSSAPWYYQSILDEKEQDRKMQLYKHKMKERRYTL